MKWGVRRTPEQLGHAPRRKRISVTINGGKKQQASSPKPAEPKVESKPVEGKTQVSRSRKASTMSDTELRAAINRIEMERKYASLTAKQKSAGRKFVEDVLANAAKQTATKYTAQAMTNLVEKLLKSNSGSSGGSS